MLHPVASRVNHSWSSDGAESIHIASSDGQRATAALSADGTLTYQVRGVPAQGETDTYGCAWTLIERLNQFGENWSEPFPRPGPEDGSDMVARNGDKKLLIQITKAFADPSAWKRLSLQHELNGELTLEQAICELMEVVERKALRMAPSARVTTTLALDTSVPGVFALPAPMMTFRRKYSREVNALQFASVWLVGPTPALTWRIDEIIDSTAPISLGF